MINAAPNQELLMLPEISFYNDSDDVLIIENVEDQNGNGIGNENFDDNGNGNDNNNQEEFNNNNDFNAVDNNIQLPLQPVIEEAQQIPSIIVEAPSSPPAEQISEDLFDSQDEVKEVEVETVILDSE